MFLLIIARILQLLTFFSKIRLCYINLQKLKLIKLCYIVECFFVLVFGTLATRY
jgi:hypothetical protein